MSEIRTEIRLPSSGKYDFQRRIFTPLAITRQPRLHFYCTEIYRNYEKDETPENFAKNCIRPYVKHGFHCTNFYEIYNTTWYHMDIVIGQLGSSPQHSSVITPHFLSTSQLAHLVWELLKTATRERTDPQTGTVGGAVKGTKGGWQRLLVFANSQVSYKLKKQKLK